MAAIDELRIDLIKALRDGDGDGFAAAYPGGPDKVPVAGVRRAAAEITRRRRTKSDRERILSRASSSLTEERKMLDRLIRDGGFTLDPVSGRASNTGWAVAVAPEHSLHLPSNDVSAEKIAQWQEINAARLAPPGTKIGGWLDTETGDVWLDIVKVVRSQEQAEEIGRKANQIAIFNLTDKVEVRIGGTGEALEKAAKRLVFRMFDADCKPDEITDWIDGATVKKTAKVYSDRYRAKQKLYRRKVKPAKIANPMALPEAVNPLVIKNIEGDGDGDGIPWEKKKRKRIPPPPGWSLAGPAALKPTPPVPSTPKKPAVGSKYAGGRVAAHLSPGATPEELTRLGLSDFTAEYKPGAMGNKRMRPGKIVKAEVFFERDGMLISKPRPVLILGEVTGKRGTFAAISITSQDPGNRRDLRNTHLQMRPFAGGDKTSFANTTQIIQIRPEDFVSELDVADEAEYRRLWKQTRLFAIAQERNARRDDLRKSLFGRITSAGKGYAADKLRGGARIAQSMTAAERSARTKAGWASRERAKKVPKLPKTPGVGGGHVGAGRRGGVGHAYSNPVATMRDAYQSERREKLRRRIAGQYGQNPELKTGRTKADEVYSDPLKAYREQRDAKRSAKQRQTDLRARSKQGEASRARQARLAEARKKRIAELERDKAKADRSRRRSDMRSRAAQVGRELFDQTQLGQDLKASREAKSAKQRQRQERREAMRDLFAYVRTGDESIADKWIPKDVLEAEEAKAMARLEAEEKARDAEDKARAAEDKAKFAEDKKRKAASQKKQKALRVKREGILSEKEKAKAAEQKQRDADLAQANKDAQRRAQSRKRQEKLRSKREKLVARSEAEKTKAGEKAEADAKAQAEKDAQRRAKSRAKQQKLRSKRETLTEKKKSAAEKEALRADAARRAQSRAKQKALANRRKDILTQKEKDAQARQRAEAAKEREAKRTAPKPKPPTKKVSAPAKKPAPKKSGSKTTAAK